MKIAVFDFDGTLTTKDTFKLFVKFAKGEKKFWQGMLVHSFYLGAFAFKLIPNWYVKQKMFGFYFRGMPLQEFDQYCERFAAEVEKIERPKLLARSRQHKEQECRTIIISASIENWIRPWAGRKGFDQVIGTKIEVDAQGLITGRFETKNCFGQEKVNRLLEQYPERSSYTLFAYGDSNGDKQMIGFADEGYYINNIQ